MIGSKVQEGSAWQDTQYQVWRNMMECEGMTEGQNYRQGKSNIAPLFKSEAIKKVYQTLLNTVIILVITTKL